ncbi:hypothetical protein ABZY02_33015 [Streptomyces sp. NPDC006649]|uniref:hypothetical protein n=1 Tax=Streptomyces sp. NPDC006649 TaxID=3156896 RepID=UPI0033B27640
MSSTPYVRRTGLRALATAAAALFLAAAAPAAATAATPHATAMRDGGAITCQEVDADLPGVFGRECNGQYGPTSDFTITDASSGDSFRCRSGWSEGNLWVRGNDCVPSN